MLVWEGGRAQQLLCWLRHLTYGSWLGKVTEHNLWACLRPCLWKCPCPQLFQRPLRHRCPLLALVMVAGVCVSVRQCRPLP